MTFTFDFTLINFLFHFSFNFNSFSKMICVWAQILLSIIIRTISWKKKWNRISEFKKKRSVSFSFREKKQVVRKFLLSWVDLIQKPEQTSYLRNKVAGKCQWQKVEQVYKECISPFAKKKIYIYIYRRKIKTQGKMS